MQLKDTQLLRQQAYVEAMERHDLTIALGPAGTAHMTLADYARFIAAIALVPLRTSAVTS